MADFLINVKNFDSVNGIVGSDLTHTVAVVGNYNFRIRFDKDWEVEETKIDIPGINGYLGKFNVRLVYVSEIVSSKKGSASALGEVEVVWERKHISTVDSTEIPFDFFKKNRSNIVETKINLANIKSEDINLEKQVNDSRSRYSAINVLFELFYISKDLFDISTINPVFTHPTLYATKSDNESAAAANDGKIRVFPLGAGNATQYQVRLFEDLIGDKTWTAVPGDDWTTVVGDFIEYTGLTPRVYQVRVRDGDNTLSKFDEVLIEASL